MPAARTAATPTAPTAPAARTMPGAPAARTMPAAGGNPTPTEAAAQAPTSGNYLICSRRSVMLGSVGVVGSLLVSACTSHGTSARGISADGAAESGAAGSDPAASSAASPDVSALNSRTPGSSALTQATPGEATASASPATAPGQPTSTTSGPTPADTAAQAPGKTASPPTQPPQQAPDPAPTQATTPTPSAQPSSSPSKKPSGTVLAALSAVPAGGSLVVNGPNGPVALARPNSSNVVAHTAICTHMGCTVGAAGAMLDCPCHGSQYNAFTGAVVQGPAPAALRAISVHVDGGQIVTP